MTATLLLLCWISQPSANLTLNWCVDPGDCYPKPSPTCEVQADLVDAAVRIRNLVKDSNPKLYEITPTTNGATMKERSLPTLRAE